MSLFQGDAPTPVELESSAVQSAPQYLTNKPFKSPHILN